MKVLYVAGRYDPRDYDAASGLGYEIYHNLESYGLELSPVGPFKIEPSGLEKIYRCLHGVLIKKRPAKYPVSYLKASSSQVEAAIENTQPDVIFSKTAAPLAYCKLDRLLMYLMDTTLKGNEDQWQIFTKFAIKRMLSWESRVIRESSRLVTFSEWSAKILMDAYQVPQQHVSFFAVPASLPETVIPHEDELQEKNQDPVRILLVGRVYYRKGIDIAIEVVRMLNAQGVSSELRIVGLDGEGDSQISYMGLYKKTDHEQLVAYVNNYRWANFLIHPARFEAAAFGVPTITNAAGGLATTVADGVSGVVLPIESPAEAYVKEILRFVHNRKRYNSLCLSTRKRYEEELNWKYAGRKIAQILEGALVNDPV